MWTEPLNVLGQVIYDWLVSSAGSLGEAVGKVEGDWFLIPDIETAYRLRNDDWPDEVLLVFPIPDLSGEWADGETVSSLAAKLGVTTDPTDEERMIIAPEHLAELCDVWEEAALDAAFEVVTDAAVIMIAMAEF